MLAQSNCREARVWRSAQGRSRRGAALDPQGFYARTDGAYRLDSMPIGDGRVETIGVGRHVIEHCRPVTPSPRVS